MQTDSHHLRRAVLALFVQDIESVLDVIVKPSRIAEPRRRREEFEVVAIIAVRDHETSLRSLAVSLLRQINPVRNIVCVRIACPEKLFAHLLVHGGDESSALRRGAAVVPALRSVAGKLLESRDAVANVLLFSFGGEVLMIDPTVGVRGDVVAFFHAASHYLWLLLASGADGVEGKFHLVVVEQLEEAPPASARAVLELGFAAVVALVDVWLRWVFAETCLGNAIA